MNDGRDTVLDCTGVSINVPGRTLVENLDLGIKAGEIIAVLGPNGVGKSLSLHTLAGLRQADHGSVRLDGLPIDSVPRQRIAQRIALLPQYVEDVFPATVLDTVMIGRHPHIRRFEWESDEDRRIAMDALALVGLGDIPHRDIATLSGGERRRLAIAQVLTQAPTVYLLDEPTNHLDPQHQLDVLSVFDAKAKNGDAVVTSLHDVNLASRFADRCLLLYGNGHWELDATDAVLTERRLSDLYATTMEVINWRNERLFVAAGRDAD
ncbi:MAG: ABC transporter ATP-binding protein [Woeseiaceae bacterium]|nr:ABC transporter ATP-binding protein [Woeseiaceae bacterium]